MEYSSATYEMVGTLYTVLGPASLHAHLQGDHDYATQFLRERFGVTGASPGIEENNASASSQDSKVWEHKNVMLLLEGYRERLSRFRDPKVKKVDLWREIASVFHGFGIDVTHDILDRKFRNLKRTYTKVKQNNSTTGRNAVHWPYFDVLGEILTDDETVNIPELVGTGVGEGSSGVSQAIVPVAVVCQAPEGMGDQGAGPKMTCTPPARPTKWRRLQDYRTFYEEIERSRVNVLERIARELKESNRIQEERNAVIKKIG